VRFWTSEVEADVAELVGRGVVFEEYDYPTLKTVNGVATTAGIGKSAWFKDPDGTRSPSSSRSSRRLSFAAMSVRDTTG
jgi:hypothetical protein